MVFFVRYGAICGRNKKFEYKSFSNYCEMKSEDCDELEGTVFKKKHFSFLIHIFQYMNHISNKEMVNE